MASFSSFARRSSILQISIPLLYSAVFSSSLSRLSEAAAAHAYIESRGAFGRVVLVPEH